MEDTRAIALIKAELEREQRCACGHYQLPPARDACVALSAGVSAQHGRLSCETITLGDMPPPQIVQRPVMRGYGCNRRTVMEDRAIHLPREVRLSRLDQ